MRASLERALHELREKRSTAETKLEELKQKGGEAWDQAKTEIDETLKSRAYLCNVLSESCA
jgi:hypothetical protein